MNQMSKSVLVIETPEKCDLCMYIGTFHSFCKINCRDIKDTSVKPDWCPLMDLPEKNNGDYPANTSDAGFVEGWNQCIDEITGGEVDGEINARKSYLSCKNSGEKPKMEQ